MGGVAELTLKHDGILFVCIDRLGAFVFLVWVSADCTHLFKLDNNYYSFVGSPKEYQKDI